VTGNSPTPVTTKASPGKQKNKTPGNNKQQTNINQMKWNGMESNESISFCLTYPPNNQTKEIKRLHQVTSILKDNNLRNI
jgi:hypothetical protein